MPSRFEATSAALPDVCRHCHRHRRYHADEACLSAEAARAMRRHPRWMDARPKQRARSPRLPAEAAEGEAVRASRARLVRALRRLQEAEARAARTPHDGAALRALEDAKERAQRARDEHADLLGRAREPHANDDAR